MPRPIRTILQMFTIVAVLASGAWNLLTIDAHATTRNGLDDTGLMDNVHELGIRPDGKEVWAETLERHLVVVNIEDPNYPIVSEIHLPGFSSHPISELTFSPDSQYVYLTEALQCVYEPDCVNLGFGDLARVLVIDTTAKALAQAIPMEAPFTPTGSHAISPDGKYLYLTVADYGGQREGIYQLDLQSQAMVRFVEVPGANHISISPDGKSLYVTRGWDIHGPPANLFSVVDTTSLQVTSVPVGNQPMFAAVSADQKKAYISNYLGNSVSVVDLVLMQVKTTVDLIGRPDGIVLTPDGEKAYVAIVRDASGIGDYGPGTTVSVIDAEKDVYVKEIRVGIEPASLMIDPDGERVFVSDGNANGLQPAEFHVIDAVEGVYQRSVVLRKTAFYAPTGIDVSPNGSRIFVISEAQKSLLAIDPANDEIQAAFRVDPRAVKVSHDGQKVYVYSARYMPDGNGHFFVIDANSLQVLKSFDLGLITTHSPWDSIAYRIALNSSETTAYLAGGDGDEVIVVDLIHDTVVKKIWVGAADNHFIVPARGIAITPDDQKVFVSSCLAQNVSVIDTASNTIVATIPVDGCPSEVKITPDGRRVYVQRQAGTALMAILDAQALAMIKSVDFPPMVGGVLDFYLPDDELSVYAICFDPNWVMVFDLVETNEGKVIDATIRTRLDPFNAAITADKRLLFVTNFTSDSISVIDTSLNQVVDTIPIPLPSLQYLPFIQR